jgi:hypothetical protein
MIENTGNLWDYDVQVLGITTSSFLRSNGSAVMESGCALAAQRKFPLFEAHLGELIRQHGNRCFHYAPRTNNGAGRQYTFLTFPVTADSAEDGRPELMYDAELEIIERSARQTIELADKFGWASIVLPRPGCGDDRLAWSDVKDIVSPILDDRFTVLAFEQEPLTAPQLAPEPELAPIWIRGLERIRVSRRLLHVETAVARA